MLENRFIKLYFSIAEVFNLFLRWAKFKIHFVIEDQFFLKGQKGNKIEE
jgi:hypothetical protein